MTALLYSVEEFPQPEHLKQTTATTEMLCIEGADAVAFAHAQLASDARSLPSGQWQWSAWLDARGRVRTVGQLARDEQDRLYYFLRGGKAESIAKELGRYLFRSRATIAAPGGLHPRPGEPLDDGLFHASGDRFQLGFGERSLCLEREPPRASGRSHAEQVRSDISAGFPWLPEGLPAQLPPALGLYRLGAVCLDKGCYPGQEMVSRLHHLGGAKRHLHHVRMASADIPQRIDAQVGSGGWVLLRDGTEALVVLDDRSTGAAESFEILQSFAP